MDMDILTRFSNGQVLTTDVVSDLVLTSGADLARNVFMRPPYIVKVVVTVLFGGCASGMRVEARFDTEAGLASGSQIVVGDSGVLLPTQLEAAGVMHQFRLRPIALPSGYDFFGIFYNMVSEAASGGAAVRTWLAEGAETAPPPM